MKKLMIGILISIIIVGGLGYYKYSKFVGKKIEYNQTLEIKQGGSLKASLKKLSINTNSILFKLFIKTKNDGKDIKIGLYEIRGQKNLKEIFEILEEGKSQIERYTILEGNSYRDVVKLFTKGDKEKEKEFEEELKKIDFPYPTPNGNFEGYFYPETYFIPKNYSMKKKLEVPLKYFIKMFPTENYPNKEEFYKKLIMASILEREAMVKSEKAIMASVFYNRLEKDMTFSSDATVNYLYNYTKKRMYYKDLKIDSPYNTYMYKGLPPGPIANPDKHSVEAAYNPLETDYLFFVARGDGSHFFSRTYKEHLEFQKNNKK